ncbi:hypothetical protein GJ633_09385 [Halorubrum sp. CBA1125]|nr:hypothetical protein [Halorubrum sp. CBA1125]MUW14852.1 hypothetical protein [Halorubrum sp. CBA1125]
MSRPYPGQPHTEAADGGELLFGAKQAELEWETNTDPETAIADGDLD